MIEKLTVPELLNRIDGSGSDKEYEAIDELRKLGNEFPGLLLEKYKTARQWRVRTSCVYHSIRYARSSKDAVDLGVLALADKSYVVRFRACGLLAYSLEKRVLCSLERLECRTSHEQTRLDARAAIEAIQKQNSDYFLDRDHSGRISWKVD